MNDKERLALLDKALRELKLTTQGYKQWVAEGKKGGHWSRAMLALNKLHDDLEPPDFLWAALGPVQPGGVSLLNMSLTHPTSGIRLFPAVDTAWGGGGGVTVIAPEDCVVDTKDTSSSPGEAVYLTGISTLRHWVGHLNRDWPLGHHFDKGDLIGKTLPIPGQSDHAHWGVNAEALLGKGKQLFWGGAPSKKPRRYALGSPTIGEQLRKALL